MKKIFKALAVAAASTALCAGIAMTTTGCNAGYNGTYEGEYKYSNYGHDYGIKVRVTVENNIITKVVDITKGAYVVVSDANPAYGWTEDAVANWTNNESYLLQKYEGWAVSDILAIQVFIKENGEPYGKTENAAMSDLMISGATQGSGRLLLAVQAAFGQTVEIGRIEK